MANETSLYQEQWDSRVMAVYQQKGFLTKGMAMPPAKIVGKKMHYSIVGKGEAQDYTPRDKVKTMNLVKGQIEIDATEWDAADYIYDYDLDRMPVTVKDATVEAAAAALGRKHDKVLYAKMQAKDFNAIGQVVGSFAAASGPSEMLKGRRLLFNQDVPVEDGQNFCGLPPIVFDTMMSYNVFSNSQWTGGNLPFADGMRRRTWQNIHFFELPVYLQSVSGTDGKFYMWHRSALGTGITGEEIKTGWKYELEFKRWYYQSTISAGATLIEEATVQPKPGIVEIRYKADVEPTFT